MIIIPAIDLKDHQVVRLSQGKMDQAKIYADSPLLMAKDWVDQGAKRLHLVDLNGAFQGKPVHFEEVKEICEAYPEIKVEIGGGIRDLETIQKYADCGVSFMILGTAALKNPDFLKKACERFPKKIILGLDAKDGMVATDGWDKVSAVKAVDFVSSLKDLAIHEIIYTDISKDGMMHGMNLESIAEMAGISNFGVIASGGLTSLEDIKALKEIKNVTGVIAGKAIYEGLFGLKEAIALAH